MEDTTIEDVLKTFGDFYAKKDYANALATIEKLKKSVPPADWHYNMGSVRAEMGELPLARYHFLQAESLGFSGPEASKNLELVENKLGTTKLEKSLSPSDYAVKTGLALHNGLLTSLGLLMVTVGLLIIKRRPKLWKVPAVLGLAILPMILNWWIGTWPMGIAPTTIEVHEGPSEIFGRTSEIPPGVKVLFQRAGEWTEIIYPSRFSGWVKTGQIKELEEI